MNELSGLEIDAGQLLIGAAEQPGDGHAEGNGKPPKDGTRRASLPCLDGAERLFLDLGTLGRQCLREPSSLPCNSDPLAQFDVVGLRCHMRLRRMVVLAQTEREGTKRPVMRYSMSRRC